MAIYIYIYGLKYPGSINPNIFVFCETVDGEIMPIYSTIVLRGPNLFYVARLYVIIETKLIQSL